MSFEFLSEYYIYFINGAKLTLIISIISVFFGTLIGTVLCFMKRSEFSILKFKPLKVLASIYIELVRGTPLLLQIFMVYNGSAILFNLKLEALPAAVIAISLNSGAYVAELIRAGIEAVDKGQLEAARSLGMSEYMAMRLVVIPQAIRNILPAIGNEFVAIIKESSMASTIGVAELMFAAKLTTGKVFLSFEPLIISAIFYFIMTFSLGRFMNYIERRLNTDVACK